MKKRSYRQRRRADQQEKTRLRIVEAAMALHEELGPRETSISQVAARAGVQRLTVYRHFPDAEALFQACTSHWLALHSPPEPQRWHEHGEPEARTRHALEALYSYYRETARMWARSYRDLETVPALRVPMDQFERYLAEIRADLAAAWTAGRRAPKQLEAALGLATHFRTWETLERHDLGDHTMAEMMAGCCKRASLPSGRGG
jgi:AcrR family transcriptional regulator